VRSATSLAPVPFVPEIILHQADDIYATWELTESALGQTGLAPPFWSVAWPGGQALARYLLDHPELVIGAAAIAMNAAVNDVPVPICVGDASRAGVRADVVVAGDVWYERELADQVTMYLDEMAAAGVSVLTGDIGRTYFPAGRYVHLTSYEIPVSVALEGRQVVTTSVWRR